MPEIGQHFTPSAWQNIAGQSGEIRLRDQTHTDGTVSKQLYATRKSLAEKAVGVVRDGFSSSERVTKRQAAMSEFKAFLGKRGDAAFAHAGIREGKPLTGRQISSAMAFVAQGKSHDGMLKDPTAFVHLTKIRDLEQQLENAPLTRPVLIKDCTDKINNLKQETVGTFAQKKVDAFEQHFASQNGPQRNEAMKLAIEIKTITHGIASKELNNPKAQTALCHQYFKAHAEELGQTHAPGVLKLAEQLASQDPLMALMRGKLSPEEATWQIRVMADKAGVSPSDMLSLLKQQLGSELGARTQQDVQDAFLKHDSEAAGVFDFEELRLPGELAPSLFKSMVGNGEPTFDQDGLKFTDGTKTKLNLLQSYLGDGEAGIEHVVLPKSDSNAVLLKNDDGKYSIRKPEPNAPPMSNKIGDWKRYVKSGPVQPGEKRSIHWEHQGDLKNQRSTTKYNERKLERVEKKFDKILTGIDGTSASKLEHDGLGVALPGTRGLTENQYGLLRSVRMKETERLNAPDPSHPQQWSPKEQVLDFLKTRYGLDNTEAGKLLEKTTEWFRTAPLTITFKADDHFKNGAAPKYGTDYKTAMEIAEKKLSSHTVGDLVGGNGVRDGVNTASKTVDDRAEVGDRGNNYVRWRDEKDSEETQFRSLSRGEQAIFGGVNLNFGKTSGFEGDASAYGESHMVLKDEVRERAAFNFNKSRALCQDAPMLMYEIIQNRNQGTDKSAFIDSLVHNALDLPGVAQIPTLQVEVEIFGEFDMVKDVQAVHIPGVGTSLETALENGSRANLENFYQNQGIPVNHWDKDAIPASVKGQQLKDDVKNGTKLL